MTFPDRLHDRIRATGSRVCLGLDPRPEAHPLTHPERHPSPAAVADAVRRGMTEILEATHARLACCKPQLAFFEALGLPGLEALAAILERARALDLPVVLDGKRGDIGSTAEAYATAYLGDGAFAADALTVNPFLGLDTLEPFLSAASSRERGVYVLVRTSNPGSGDLQGRPLADGRRVYQALADALAERAETLPAGRGGYTVLGAVVGATRPEALAELRQRLPRAPLLVPGYGAQGGSATDVAAAFDADGLGAVISASRSLTSVGGDTVRAWAERAAAALEAMIAALERARLRGSAGS